MKISNSIRIARQNLFLSQEEFAKELGMDPSEIVIHVHVCQYDNNGGAVGWVEKDYNELKEIVAEKYNPEKDAQKNTQKNTRADSEVVRNDNEPTR